MDSSMAKGTARAYNYTAIFYSNEKNTPRNWESAIQNMHVPTFVSLLHEPDEGKNGEAQKPHRHLLLKFTRQKSLAQINAILYPLQPTITIAQPVNDLHAMERYFLHMDNPEKQQFTEQIKRGEYGMFFAGYVPDFEDESKGNEFATIREIVQCNAPQNMGQLYDILDALGKQELIAWITANSAHSMAARDYVNRGRW